MEELISIIVSMYNSEKTIEKCLNSILNQTYTKLEIIIIDDGSNDNTLSICKKIAKNDKRVKVISKKNEGVSKTRNLGIKEANGRYIQFVDADDELELNMCEKLLEKMKINKLDLVICGYKIYTQEKKYKEKNIFADDKLDSKTMDYLYDQYFLNPVWNKMYLKEKIIDGFIDNISIGEDLLFNISYIENISRIGIVSETLYKYNIIKDNCNSLSRRYNENINFINVLMYKEMTRLYEKKFAEKNVYVLKKVLKNNIFNSFDLIANAKKIKYNKKKKLIINIIQTTEKEKIYSNSITNRVEEKIINTLIQLKFIGFIIIFFNIKNFIRSSINF